MLNPYFIQGTSGEQSLIQDLINEQLRMYGVEVYYIPRKYMTEKTVIKEIIESKFDDAYPIEAYIDNFDGYGENNIILSKFGIQAQNEINLIISKERFENYISPLIKNQSNIELSSRPKEGDLVYFPLGDRIFEIKFVEHEKPFYQLQKNYVYELRCELFRYEDEIIDTGIDEIDNNIEDLGYIQTLQMVGSASTATAIGGIVNGGVRFITVTNRGNGYTSAPRVAISSAPSGGITAVGIATLITDLIDCDGNKSLYKVQGVELINSGAGYTVAPTVVFVGGGGAGAAATSTIGDGVVGIVTITSGGGGYNIPPVVTFSAPLSGSGVTATGSAYINSAGIVTSIRITNSGLGYTSAPTITISAPHQASYGDFIRNETVTGSISGTTAIVREWDSSLNVLKVSRMNGEFLNNDVLTGSESGATHAIRSINTYNAVDTFADNDTIQDESIGIIDFSEKNPFGMP